MSRARLLILIAASLLLAATAGADPLLTKPQIAKAAAEVEACLAKEATKSPSKPSACIGIIQTPCDDNISAGGEAAHATCADNETAAWDLLLNQRWAELSESMDNEKFAALKSVQKMWLAYRDAKCAYLQKDDETMMGYMNAAFCRLDETSRRTLELRDLGG